MKNRFWALVIRNPETKEINRVIVLPGRKCTECGLCCLGFPSPLYSYKEKENLPPSYRVFITSKSNKRRFFSYDRTACSALCGTPYKACSCAVQDRKPIVCTEYRPGGGPCRSEIMHYERHLCEKTGEELFNVTAAEAKRRFHIIVKEDGTWRKAA